MQMTLTLKNFQCAVHNCTCRNEESLARFNWTTVTVLDHITKKHLTLPGRWYPFFILDQVFFCWLYEVKHFLTLEKNGPNFVITVRQTMNLNNIIFIPNLCHILFSILYGHRWNLILNINFACFNVYCMCCTWHPIFGLAVLIKTTSFTSS